MTNIYQAKGSTLADQYEDVGQLFRATIQANVRKIGKSRARLLTIRKKVAERTWNNIASQAEYLEFLECFRAWCKGAEITPEQGMWLMADNLSGCQTLMVRYTRGVALLHSEEEFRDTNHMELHMTDPHTISFRVNGVEAKTLVYNNLFPGAGLFGWKRDLIVAVDSIFLKEDGIESVEKPVLANVIAWMIWRMAPDEADPEKIISDLAKMGTLVDGYVINVVSKLGNTTQGYKLILARDEAKIIYLSDQIGEYLKQVNIVDANEVRMKWALPPRNIWRGGYRYFTNRIKTLKLHAERYKYLCQKELTLANLEDVHRKIQQTIYGELAPAYVHADLGAVCIGFIDHATGTSISCKLNDGNLEELAYLDRE